MTLDIPWRPARAGRQKRRESKGRKEEERGRKKKEGEDQAGPAKMTSGL